jgi:hypothetical protein
VADDDDARRLAGEQRLVGLLDDVDPLEVEARLVAGPLAVEPRPASVALAWGI